MASIRLPQGGIKYVLATQDQIDNSNKLLLPMDVYLDYQTNELIFVPKDRIELPKRDSI